MNSIRSSSIVIRLGYNSITSLWSPMGSHLSALHELMGYIFWESHRIILIDSIEKGNTIRDYYLKDEIMENGFSLRKKVKFNNLMKTIAKLHENCSEIFSHPPCITDLVFNHFFISSELKRAIAINFPKVTMKSLFRSIDQTRESKMLPISRKVTIISVPLSTETWLNTESI